jgi:hypothetical protein
MLIAFEPLDAGLRGILENLTAGLIPLQKWIHGKKYDPAADGFPAPWRAASKSLAPRDMEVIPFFEGLLRESATDADRHARWAKIRAYPLRFSPLDDPAAWRARRGLDPDPKFGITESKNVLTDADGKPITRAVFYAAYWPMLRQAVGVANPQGPDGWEEFAQKLFRDELGQWPKEPPLRSSVFIKQFAADILYAMMGMRNPRPHKGGEAKEDEAWQVALLIELGERRRVGNAYKPAQAQAAVDALAAKIKAFKPGP